MIKQTSGLFIAIIAKGTIRWSDINVYKRHFAMAHTEMEQVRGLKDEIGMNDRVTYPTEFVPFRRLMRQS